MVIARNSIKENNDEALLINSITKRKEAIKGIVANLV